MNREDSIELSFKMLAAIWGETEGYVFLPILDRGKPWDEGPAFHWPTGRAYIQARISDHWNSGVEQYFTPGVYSSPNRAAKNLVTRDRLWADLDSKGGRPLPTPPDVDPAPAFLWRTSPGNYQAVWSLSSPLPDGGVWLGTNKALTDKLGGDPHGQSGSKVLRIPGSWHHKDPRKPLRGRVIRARRSLVTDPSTLPVVAAQTLTEVDVADVIDGPRSGRPVPGNVRWQRNAPDGPRHVVLGRLIAYLLNHGHTPADCFHALRGSVVDKWDDDTRLAQDIARTVNRRTR